MVDSLNTDNLLSIQPVIGSADKVRRHAQNKHRKKHKNMHQDVFEKSDEVEESENVKEEIKNHKVSEEESENNANDPGNYTSSSKTDKTDVKQGKIIDVKI